MAASERIVTLPVHDLPVGPAAAGAANEPSQKVVRMHVSEEWLSQYRNDPAAPALTVAPTTLLSPTSAETAARTNAPPGPPIVGFHVHGSLPRKSVSATSSGGAAARSPTKAGAAASKANGDDSNGIEMTTPLAPPVPPRTHTKQEVEEKEEAVEAKRKGVSRRPVDWKQVPRQEKTLNYLIKFGRRGSPKEKLVVFDVSRGLVSWRDPQQAKCTRRPTIKVVLLKEVTDIRKGKSTPAFARNQAVAKKADPNTCISLFTSTRALSLQAPNEEDRNTWYDRICDAFVAERAQSNHTVRTPLIGQLAGVMGTLDSDVRKTWTKGMRGAPAYMIAKDFHRLAHNFAVYISDRDPVIPPPTSSASNGDEKHANGNSAAIGSGGAGLWERHDATTVTNGRRSDTPDIVDEKKRSEEKKRDDATRQAIIASSPTAADINRRRIDDCQHRAGSAHNVKAVLHALSRAVLPDDKAAVLMASLERHQAGVAAGQRENDRMLEALFEENFGESSVGSSSTSSGAASATTAAAPAAPAASASADAANSTSTARSDLTVAERGILAILKLCNQNVLFPAVNVLKRTVLPTYGTRDYRGGWRIGIEISPSQVSVVHKKRELSEAGKFSFTWELRLVLDRTNFTRLLRVELSVVEATFYDDCAAAARADVACRLLALSQQSEVAVLHQRMIENDVLSCFADDAALAAAAAVASPAVAAAAFNAASVAHSPMVKQDGAVPSSPVHANGTPPAFSSIVSSASMDHSNDHNGDFHPYGAPMTPIAVGPPPSFASVAVANDSSSSHASSAVVAPSSSATSSSSVPVTASIASAPIVSASSSSSSAAIESSSTSSAPSTSTASSSSVVHLNASLLLAAPAFPDDDDTSSSSPVVASAAAAPPPSFDTVHVAT